MKFIVQKFGGTSVEDANAIRRAADIVRDHGVSRSVRPLVVVSACAGVTNSLVSICQAAMLGNARDAVQLTNTLEERHAQITAELDLPLEAEQQSLLALRLVWRDLRSIIRAVELLGELTPRMQDKILSCGERASSIIIAAHLQNISPRQNVVLADARSFFITDSTFTFAKPKLATIKKRMAPLARKLRSGEIIVTQGFIGATERGETTTIGRGGSDYSASIMGVALKADEIQIWTDVAGIYTCDPRITPSAFAQEFVSFTEASVMARYGAKVLHPETIGPAVAAHIPVKVLSSRYPQLAGTTIVHTAVVDQPVTGIAVIKKIRILHLLSKNKIPGANNMQILHSALDKLHIVPLASSIAFDNALLAFSADETPTEAFVHFEYFADITTVNDCSLITLVGAGLADAKGVAARLFQAVKNIRCYMISFGGLSNAINIAVDAGDCDKAVRLIHKTFFE